MIAEAFDFPIGEVISWILHNGIGLIIGFIGGAIFRDIYMQRRGRP